MDYSQLNWQSDFMYNEIIGLDYDEIPEEENFVVGVYTLKQFPNVTLYINIEENKVIDVFLDEDYLQRIH